VAQTRPAHAHLRHLAEGHSRASRRESSGIPHFRRVRSPVAPPRTRENWLRRASGDAERPKPWPKLGAGLGGGSGRGRRSRARSARSSRSMGMRLPFHTTLAMGDTGVRTRRHRAGRRDQVSRRRIEGGAWNEFMKTDGLSSGRRGC
jgi:hypothetical protein